MTTKSCARSGGIRAGAVFSTARAQDSAAARAAPQERMPQPAAVPPFAVVGPELEARGFQPIPISLPDPRDPSAGKRPACPDWQHPKPVAARLPRYGRCGTGILTRHTPAVDIDVRHAECADAIRRLALRRLGEAPARYGQAPKCLLPYRIDEPFPKAATAECLFPGEPPDAKRHKVEVLGDGQQFVAVGVHPGTGRPYAWPDGSLLDLEWQDLTPITREQAAAFLAEAERVLLAHGARPVSGSGRARPKQGPWQPGPAPRPAKSLAEAERVIAALRRIDPGRLDRDAWIAVGYGVKAALGEHGRELWLAWSQGPAEAPNPKHHHAETPATMWARIRPERCGWRFLERLAETLAGETRHD